MTVTWFPITCAHTIISASLITGFTFPGMMEEPGCTAGRVISASPEVGPLASQRMSLAIFSSATASVLSAPEAKTYASFAPCASKWFSASRNSSPVRG